MQLSNLLIISLLSAAVYAQSDSSTSKTHKAKATDAASGNSTETASATATKSGKHSGATGSSNSTKASGKASASASASGSAASTSKGSTNGTSTSTTSPAIVTGGAAALLADAGGIVTVAGLSVVFAVFM